MKPLSPRIDTLTCRGSVAPSPVSLSLSLPPPSLSLSAALHQQTYGSVANTHRGHCAVCSHGMLIIHLQSW